MSQVYKIGRDIDNNLVLEDKLVETIHAHVYINDSNELVLLDLKSKYGSLVNGARVSECVLRPGDQLQIGFSKIDWIKIEAELRTLQIKTVAVKKMPAKVFTEVETNYSGKASYKLATEALQMEIAPKVAPVLEKPEIIDVTAKPAMPEKSIEDKTVILISEPIKVPSITIEITKENLNPVPDKNLNKVYKQNALGKVKNKKSFEEIISNVDSLYLFLIIMLLTMFFLGWVISIIT